MQWYQRGDKEEGGVKLSLGVTLERWRVSRADAPGCGERVCNVCMQARRYPGSPRRRLGTLRPSECGPLQRCLLSLQLDNAGQQQGHDFAVL